VKNERPYHAQRCHLGELPTVVVRDLVPPSPLHDLIACAHLSAFQRDALERYRSTVRQRQFVLGRISARLALSACGMDDPPPVERGELGEPLWPSPYLGSVAHTADVAVAVAAHGAGLRGVGIDVERCDRAISAGAAERICGSDELEWASAGKDAAARVLRVFSAKESLFKALSPSTRIPFSFSDATIAWSNHTHGRAQIRHSSGFEARLEVHVGIRDGLLITLAVWEEGDDE
jgi:4'-phosphopantetheinyl transferase EntD